MSSQVRNIVVILFLGVSIIFWSCSPKESHVKFRVYNLGTSDVFVKYYVLNTIDTIDVQITPSQNAIIWDALHVGTSSDYTNWYYDFEIQINCITNIAGDSTFFNPNIANYWTIANNEETEYRLYVGDTSF